LEAPISLLLLALPSAFVSLATCIAIIGWQRRLVDANLGVEALSASIQAIHSEPTPRLAGIAILAGMCTGAIATWSALPQDLSAFWLPIATAAPVFAAGLLDDLKGGLAPRWRLMAAAVGGGIFIAASGQWIGKVDVAGLDWLLAASPLLAMTFTIFACVGATHAVNLIDGLNGLAGAFGVAASLCLALVAHNAGLGGHASLLTVLAATITGFLFVNFPHGKIFLGDAGAYTIGHIMAWTIVSIMSLAGEVSAFAMLLIFFWPVCDTCFTVARRIYAGREIGQPDRGHLHHVVYAAVIRIKGERGWKVPPNPLSALIIVPLMAAPMAFGVALVDDTPSAAMACAGFFGLYVATYFALDRFASGANGAVC
jgi:UDP-GlcNAc:undecaprenyl-phosphate/decaprenyl-phosphate GlcNAc-1-phosphate transferase